MGSDGRLHTDIGIGWNLKLGRRDRRVGGAFGHRAGMSIKGGRCMQDGGVADDEWVRGAEAVAGERVLDSVVFNERSFGLRSVEPAHQKAVIANVGGSFGNRERD